MNMQLVTKRNTYSGEKLIHSEWFGDIVVCAKIKRLYLAGSIISTGQHHNRNGLSSHPDHFQ